MCFIAVNEWWDEKAGQYLAVYLKDDAKAVRHSEGSEAEILGMSGFVEVQERLKFKKPKGW